MSVESRASDIRARLTADTMVTLTAMTDTNDNDTPELVEALVDNALFYIEHLLVESDTYRGQVVRAIHAP